MYFNPGGGTQQRVFARCLSHENLTPEAATGGSLHRGCLAKAGCAWRQSIYGVGSKSLSPSAAVQPHAWSHSHDLWGMLESKFWRWNTLPFRKSKSNEGKSQTNKTSHSYCRRPILVLLPFTCAQAYPFSSNMSSVTAVDACHSSISMWSWSWSLSGTETLVSSAAWPWIVDETSPWNLKVNTGIQTTTTAVLGHWFRWQWNPLNKLT